MTKPPRSGWSDRHDAMAADAGWSSWAEWVESLEQEKGHTICGRKRRHEPSPCTMPEAWGVTEKTAGACKHHGGRNPRGAAHPAYKNGKHSEYAHVELLEDVRKLVDLNEAELLDTALGGYMKRLGELYAELEDPESERSRKEIYAEVFQANDRLRKAVDSRRQLFVDLHLVVTKDRLVAFVHQVGRAHLEAIEEHVSDPEERKAVRRAIHSIVAEFLGASSKKEITQ